MERHTSAGTYRGAPPALAALAVAAVVIALGVGVFGLMNHRGSSGPGAHITSTLPTDGVSVALPANSLFGDISMDSPTDGWAVGVVDTAPNGGGGWKNALLVHYDGRRWTTSPESENFKGVWLNSVSMVSATEGWACGSVEDAATLRVAGGVLLHYTGGHWHAVDISKTGFAGGGELQMVSAHEGWLYAPVDAKLSNGQMNPDSRTLVIHYHNGAWQLFSSVPGYDQVSMLSAREGWAITKVTNAAALRHYQSGAWTQVDTPAAQLYRIAMVSPTEGWIAASDQTGALIALHYDGHAWSQMTLPDPGHSLVSQIAVAAPGDIWFIGETNTDTLAAKTVAWHYSKGQWTLVDLNFTGAHPVGTSMASPDAGWVIGNSGNSAALLRYDHGSWTKVYVGE